MLEVLYFEWRRISRFLPTFGLEMRSFKGCRCALRDNVPVGVHVGLLMKEF